MRVRKLCKSQPLSPPVSACTVCKREIDEKKYDGGACLSRPWHGVWCLLTCVLRRAVTCMCAHPRSPLARGTSRWQLQCTPLHLAALQGHQEVADVLLAKGANVNATGAVRAGGREGRGGMGGEGGREWRSKGRRGERGREGLKERRGMVCECATR